MMAMVRLQGIPGDAEDRAPVDRRRTSGAAGRLSAHSTPAAQERAGTHFRPVSLIPGSGARDASPACQLAVRLLPAEVAAGVVAADPELGSSSVCRRPTALTTAPATSSAAPTITARWYASVEAAFAPRWRAPGGRSAAAGSAAW